MNMHRFSGPGLHFECEPTRRNVKLLRAMADSIEASLEQELLEMPPVGIIRDIDPIVIQEVPKHD